MLEAMSCWKVDWSAVGAVATAAATCVALGVVVKDSYARGVLRRRAARIAKLLLEDELSQLASYGEGWETFAILVAEEKGKSDYKGELERALLVPNLRTYLDNQINLSEDVVLAIAAVVSLATVFRKSLTPEKATNLFKPRDAYETHFVALTAEVKRLRELLQRESESC